MLTLFFVLSLGALAPAATEKPLRVVATIPDLADFLQIVGGKRVKITTLTRGGENLHAVIPRPSHVVAMSRADAFFQVGLSLESTFVPGLLLNARNQKILPGAPGLVTVSDGWEALNVPASLSRQGGDLHPQGNPHINLDPAGGLYMARAVKDALVRLDPGSTEYYESRFAAYAERLAEAQVRWDAYAERLRGKQLVVVHMEYTYIAQRLGLEIVGSLEVRPGIPATPNHLAKLIATMQEQEIEVIAIALWNVSSNVDRVEEATGARVVVLPNQVGGMPGAETWLDMMDLLHVRLAEAFGVADDDPNPEPPR